MTWGAVATVVTKGVMDKRAADKAQHAADRATMTQQEQSAEAQARLAPYEQFGAEQLGEMRNWLRTPEGRGAPSFREPTMEEVMASPGYASRLGAVESSAAARGGLFSGNALRNIGEFGASEYGREYDRRQLEYGRGQTEYQNELAKRMGFANIGYGAAGGGAGISQNLGQRLSQIQLGAGATQAGYQQGVGSTIGAGIGAYQGQQNWNEMLSRFGSRDRNADNEDDYGELGW